MTMSKTRIPITTLFLSCALAWATPSSAEETATLSPVFEGWINSGANEAGRWSIARPDALGCRNRGSDTAWATYLGFELPAVLPDGGGEGPILRLTQMSPRSHEQRFWLYGLADLPWMPETLRAVDAPAWDAEADDIEAEAAELLAEAVGLPGEPVVAFGPDERLSRFLEANAGGEVTLILVADDGSTFFHSTEGDAEKGPVLRLE